ncbi:MAG: ABC transporter permease [Chloroflexi bacterium]|nr:MAG: ABC transporter permease [Chloroflexota bacterium]
MMYLFEGTIYDLISSFVGLLAGVGIGALLIYVLGPILARFDFPLKPTFQPRSMIIAYCLGVIFTFCSVVLSSWLVSRMTVVEALRDLPEATRTAPSLGELLSSIASLWRSPHAERMKLGERIRRAVLEQIPEIVLGFVWLLTSLGIVPLLVGLWLMQVGLVQAMIIPFSCGFSLIVLGIALLLKAVVERIIWFVRRGGLEQHVRAMQKVTSSILAALVGMTLLAYWALPFDILEQLSLPRFLGGIEVFFIAGFMMILGAVWALVANIGLFMRPLLALWSRFPGIYTLMKLALAYPLQRRFRMGMSVMMFSLVVFAMTVMAIITNAMQQSYVDINTQTGGYDIQATAYFKPLPDLRSSLEQHGVPSKAFSAIGVRDTTAVGIIQLSAAAPRWYVYPAQVIDGGFLHGYGLHLTARATGFANDSAVWQALQAHPNYALIDSNALPYRPHAVLNGAVYDPSVPQGQDAGVPAIPPGLDARDVFAMSGVHQGDTTFAATPVWVVGLRGSEAVKLTIIGVVDNSDSAHYGLYMPRATYSSSSIGTVVTNEMPMTQSYYFKIAPGQDKRQVALALGSAFLDYGLETTVLEDAIWQVRGPRIFLSNVLLGIVGMTLLLGVAALAITGTRAVIERRQQIGMLRALGCPRHLIQGAFLLESFLVGLLGSLLGVVLGVMLARNIFAANFFEQYQTGLYFSIPWQQLAIIIGVALLASFFGALLPAWQAGRVAPAEALRYQ